MHVGSMESNVGTIAITVTSTIEAERLKQNLMNSNNNSSSSSGRGNMPSIRMSSHDSTNHDVESGRLGHHNASSSSSSSSSAAATTTTAVSTAAPASSSSSILNTHLSQRERKISQKLNPNLNPDHPYSNNSSSSANIGGKSYNDSTGDSDNNYLPSSTTTGAGTGAAVVKERKKVQSTRVIDSFEISDASSPTDRKSKSKK